MSDSQIKVTLIDHMGSDLSVVNSARVSMGKSSKWEDQLDYECSLDNPRDYPSYQPKLKTTDVKLIKYLASHGHYSPFGHCFASFHVKAPVFVARQLVKHKFLRWNEISRRYVSDTPEFYEPDTWRGKAEDVKQGSAGYITSSCVYDYSGELTHPKFVADDVSEYSLQMYKNLLDAGVAPEQARMVLPQSLMTEWFWSGSLDAFSDMCNLRCKPDTQYESQLVGDQVDEIIGGLFPVSWENLRS